MIAEIETDKATMEVEAVDEGKLGKILVAAGTSNVAVNAPIAVLLEEGEDISSIGSAPTSNPIQSTVADFAFSSLLLLLRPHILWSLRW